MHVSKEGSLYNKKITKYYVVYEEGDESLSENEERQEQRDVEATLPRVQNFPIPIHHLCPITFQPQVADDNVNFKRLGHERVPSESEDDKSEKEASAKQANGPKQDTCGVGQNLK